MCRKKIEMPSHVKKEKWKKRRKKNLKIISTNKGNEAQVSTQAGGVFEE